MDWAWVHYQIRTMLKALVLSLLLAGCSTVRQEKWECGHTRSVKARCTILASDDPSKIASPTFSLKRWLNVHLEISTRKGITAYFEKFEVEIGKVSSVRECHIRGPDPVTTKHYGIKFTKRFYDGRSTPTR